MAAGYVASATSGSQASVATFNIGTLGTGARAGIVFVCIHNSATDIITGVTWNSVAMTALYKATDTDTEPGVVKAYFLDNVTNGVITVSRTNNTVVTVGYAASISGTALEAFQTITRVSSTQNTNADTSTTGTGASGTVAVDDGKPGSNSIRFAAAYTGAATPVAADTGTSTSLQSLDSTALGSRFVRETTAGQGSRSVGFATGTTDDWALVAVAVREKTVIAQPGAGAVSIAGDTPTVTVTVNVSVQPAAAAVSIAGATPSVVTSVGVQPAAAAVTIGTATPAIVAQNWPKAEPAAAAISVAGATPAIVAQNWPKAQPAAASITIGTATPAIATPVSIAPSAAAVSISGATSAVVAQNYILAQPGAAAVAIGGATPAVVAQNWPKVQPAAAEIAIAGATPTVSAGASLAIQPGAASVTIAGATPDVLAQNYVTILPGAAAMAFAGATPTVTLGAGVYINPDAAGLVITGAVPTITGGIVAGGKGGRGRPRQLPNLPDPDADEAYLLALGVL